MTQNKDLKQKIRARMAATGEPYTAAARNLGKPLTPASMWLNPPHHDDPHEDIIIEMHPATAAVAADALAEAAGWAERDGDGETARILNHLADDIEAASVTPAEADQAGLSREATWHPANIMQRLTPAAVRNAARYLGPSYVASMAIKTPPRSRGRKAARPPRTRCSSTAGGQSRARHPRATRAVRVRGARMSTLRLGQLQAGPPVASSWAFCLSLIPSPNRSCDD